MAKPLKPITGLIPHGCETFVVSNGTGIRVANKSGGVSEVFFESISTVQRIVLGVPLDINAMTLADFDRIPGVGPVLAKRIIEYRQINGGRMGVEALLLIDGIGEKKYIILSKYFNRP